MKQMLEDKKDIVRRLRQEILPLQGMGKGTLQLSGKIGLGPIEAAFPNACFPTAAVHEFLYTCPENAAASAGFVSGLMTMLMQENGVCIWISAGRTLFPPALARYNISPERVIFIDLKQELQVLWAMEEALKCNGLAAVVGEMRGLDFTASRRLQLAVEQSRVTGFLLRKQPRTLNPIAAVSRWRINPLASVLEEGMPGVGFPRWRVELLKVRNGQPGAWDMEWSGERFRILSAATAVERIELERKTG